MAIIRSVSISPPNATPIAQASAFMKGIDTLHQHFTADVYAQISKAVSDKYYSQVGSVSVSDAPSIISPDTSGGLRLG